MSAKIKPMFSLKAYLLKKAEKRLAKLQYREEKRNQKANAQTHQHTHEVVHNDEQVEEPEVAIEVEE